MTSTGSPGKGVRHASQCLFLNRLVTHAIQAGGPRNECGRGGHRARDCTEPTSDKRCLQRHWYDSIQRIPRSARTLPQQPDQLVHQLRSTDLEVEERSTRLSANQQPVAIVISLRAKYRIPVGRFISRGGVCPGWFAVPRKAMCREEDAGKRVCNCGPQLV